MESSVDGLDDRITEFRDFSTSTLAIRTLAEKCRDYKNNEQLSEEERKALKRRKQPPVIDNKIQDKCDTLLGIEQQTRTDPKAFPRTPQHEDDADAATDALRYVKDDNAFTEITTAAFDNLIVEGLCAGEVIIEPRKGKPPRVRMNRIRWERTYYDPHSLELDYSDANYKGFFTWMDLDEAKAMPEWKGKEDILDQCFSGESLSTDQTHEDKPRFAMISDKRKRVQVFTTYYRKADYWMRAVWCVGGYLEGPQPSNYKDEDGRPDCCIELQAVYKDRDGNPFGAVPRWIDLQDEHNKRRSKMMHLLNTKQIHAEKGAYEDINKARNELHKPDGVIEYTQGMKSEIVTNLDMSQGQFQLMQYTDQQLSMTGPNAALMGQTGNISGRAKQVDQQSGMLMTAPLANALRSWKTRMYRHAWNRIRQYWTAPMWIRVTDNEDNVRFAALNQPTTMGELQAKRLAKKQIAPEQKAAMVQQIASDPQAMGRTIENNVAEMDVDIIIDEAPDTVIVQSEEFEKLVRLAESGAVKIPPRALIAASQLRAQTKKQVMDELSGANDPQAQQMAQMQAQMMELQAALAKANVEKTAAQAEQAKAAAVESQVDASIKVAEFTSPQPEGEGQAGAKPAAKTSVAVN